MTAEIILTIAAIITALGVIFGGVYATYRIVHRIGQALGVDAQGRTIADRLDRVEHQLWENGGSSLADRVNNIEAHVLKVSTEINFIKDLTLTTQNALLQPAPVEPTVRTARPKKNLK